MIERHMTNRTALITGASRGIGRACALALARSGARVALAARNVEKLQETGALVRGEGRDAFVLTMDIGSADSIREGCARVSKEFGRIDILVNNAAITRDGLALRMKKEDWETVLTTNL